jgi:hypothetical protein
MTKFDVVKKIGISWILLPTLLMSSAISARAQSEPGQWVEGLYCVKLFPGGSSYDMVLALIDENDVIHESIPNLRKAVDFPIPFKYRSEVMATKPWHDGFHYQLASGFKQFEKDDNGSRFERWTLGKWVDGKWEFVGEYKSSDVRNVLEAIPCKGNRMILVSSKSDLSGNTGADRTPFFKASFKGDSKEIKLDAPIPFSQDELQQYSYTEDVFSLGLLSTTVCTDDHVLLLSHNTGLYWVFSLENASLVKAGSIFRKVTPEMIAKGGFSRGVLCVNPEIGGTFLVSAQDEAFLITETDDALREYNETISPDQTLTLEEKRKILGARQLEIANRNPWIVWYRIYPEDGRVEKLSDFPEGGTLFRDGRKNDLWRPMPDGSVKMGWNGISVTEKFEGARQESHKNANVNAKEEPVQKPPGDPKRGDANNK